MQCKKHLCDDIKVYSKSQLDINQLTLGTYSFLTVVLPRFARVNLLKSTVDDAIEALVQTDFVLEEWDQVIDLYKVCGTSQDPAEPAICDHKHFAKDLHVPDVLVFCSSVNLLDHTLFTNGRIFLQDKVTGSIL